MVNIGFYCGGVGAQLVSGNDARLKGLLHDPLMDLLSTFLAKERKGPTEISKIWNRVFIEAGEASIEKAGTKFTVQLAIRPTFDVLEYDTAQQPIRSNPACSSIRFGGTYRLSAPGLLESIVSSAPSPLLRRPFACIRRGGNPPSLGRVPKTICPRRSSATWPHSSTLPSVFAISKSFSSRRRKIWPSIVSFDTRL
jgi:hypothetical protein